MRGWFLEQMGKAETAEDQEQWAELERDHFRNCEDCLRWFREIKERMEHETVSTDRGQ